MQKTREPRRFRGTNQGRQAAPASCGKLSERGFYGGFDGSRLARAVEPKEHRMVASSDPERGHCKVHQHAALLGRQTGERNRPWLCVESMARDRLERAVALGSDNVRSARRDASRRKSRSVI